MHIYIGKKNSVMQGGMLKPKLNVSHQMEGCGLANPIERLNVDNLRETLKNMSLGGVRKPSVKTSYINL